MTGIAMLNSSFGGDAPATLAYYLDAAALGAFPGSAITTSASFNGSSQYLTLPASSNWALGTGDFTIEWFQYMTTQNANPRVFAVGNYPTTSIGVSIEGGTFYVWEASGFRFSASLTSYLNTWVHFAISRVSGQTSVYQNGTRLGSAYSDTNDINDSSSVLAIAQESTASTGSYFTGYLSNFRIIKGTGLYSGASLTVPTSTLRAVAGTVVLLPLTAAPFMDVSTNLATVTNTGSVATTASAPSLTAATTDVTGNYALSTARETATFTGSCATTVLTVASGLTGTVKIGMTITGGTIPAGTYITAQLTGTTGGIGTYTISAIVVQTSTSIVGSRIVWDGRQGGVMSCQFSGDDNFGVTNYITGGPDWSTQRSYTVFMGYKLNAGTTSNYGRLLNSNTASPDWLMGGYSAYPKAYFANGVTINLTGAARDTTWHLDWARFNKTTGVGSLFSVTSVQPTSTPAFTTTNSAIGAFNQLKLFSKSDGNECAAGDIAFVRVWNGAMTTAQMQAEWAAFRTRVGF